MTREEAIRELKQFSGTTRLRLSANFWEALNRAIKLLEQEPRWIPVSEKLPEEFESVLVCYESQGGMAQAVSERFGTHTGYKWSALAGIEPIAWMPLPEPFNAEME